MKKLTSIIIALVMALTLMPAAVWAVNAGESNAVTETQTESSASTDNEQQDEGTVEASAQPAMLMANDANNESQDETTDEPVAKAGETACVTETQTESPAPADIKPQDKGVVEASAQPAMLMANDANNEDQNKTTEGSVAKVGETAYDTLYEAVEAACELGDGQTITLLKDYTVETSVWTSYLLPDNSTLDLGGNTLTVPKATAVFEGNNITIQNGRFESDASYSIWIGNDENETSATLNDITSNAGINVYAADAIIDGCSIDASNKEYYAVWADEGADVTINGGAFYGGENGVIGTASEDSGLIKIYGGTFEFNRLVPSGDFDNIVIYGGTFSNEIDSKYVDENANLVQIGNTWTVVAKDKIVENEDGSTTETKSEVTEDGSTITEITTITKEDEETGTTTEKKNETKTVVNNVDNTTTTETVETTTTTDTTGSAVTESKTEAVVTKVIDNQTVEIEKTTTEATVTTSNGTIITNETKTVVNNDTNTTTETKTEIVETEKVTTTEQTVTSTNADNESTVVTIKNVVDTENNVTAETVVDKESKTAAVNVEIGTGETTAIPANVTVDATAAKVDSDSVAKTEVTLPPQTVSVLKEAAQTDEAGKKVETVEVKTNVATLQIDNTALQTLTKAAEEDSTQSLVLTIAKTDSTVETTKNATATFELTAVLKSSDGGETPIFESADAENNGIITVNVAYTPAKDDNIVEVYYVAADGEKTKMNAEYTDGVLSWDTTHFSTYEVVETEKTVEPVNPDDKDKGNTGSDDKKTDTNTGGNENNNDNTNGSGNSNTGNKTATGSAANAGGKVLSTTTATVISATGAKTGDANDMSMWIVLLASGVAIGVLVAAKRKYSGK